MLQIQGSARGTDLTGTLYERGEEPPQFRGAPDDAAPYVWICDAFYEVESGGQTQQLGDREVQIAFESPMPRGFETREAAIEAAKEHVRTQFVRLGIPAAEVAVDVIEVADDASA
ncbi:MAG: hypothetical protein ACI8UR_001986 [Natronomonas sp.]|jgi:hypothetical protein|uniref:DUF7113 family protein n=1 Tax=Natronomonas sp. TaxID=2184060 RepID=UPI0039895240